MTVYEANVPGVGRKFELEVNGDERIVVILHHDGKREIYRRPTPDADSEKLLALSGEHARQLGAILEGAYFQPVELENVRVPLGDAIIEWIEVAPDSPVAGRTLGDARFRQQTGVSIIAIQRGEQTVENPTADEELRAGDVLVGLGTREEHAALERLLERENAD